MNIPNSETYNNAMNEHWAENVIIVDAEYVDNVAFNLIVNFERMIGRRIPQADLAQWLDCIALDGGLRPKEGTEADDRQTSVIFVHKKNATAMQNFKPGNYADNLNGKAFRDSLGEFTLMSFPVEEVITTNDFILDIVKTAANHKDVRRVMVVSNCDNGEMPDLLRQALRDVDDEKRITVFAMQPICGGNFRQEILGYSLMSALGIKASELNV